MIKFKDDGSVNIVKLTDERVKIRERSMSIYGLKLNQNIEVNEMKNEKEYATPTHRIEKTGGYMCLNFAKYLESPITDEKGWGKGELYSASLSKQYESIKRKIGENAPENFREFIAGCFSYDSRDYYISLPTFERTVDPEQVRIKNIVIRPDLSDKALRSLSRIPKRYDVIIIGDIFFGKNDLVEVTVKGIELIDSGVAKYGEMGVHCKAACAFSTKYLSSGYEVCDYGSLIDLHNPTLTRDFIDRLLKEVYSIPNPEEALSKIEKWEKYIEFRRYYLGVQSERYEKIENPEPIQAYVVSAKQYKNRMDAWSKLLLDGHKNLAKGDHAVLSKNVDGADEMPLIKVSIRKNRKEILNETVGKNSRGKLKYENHLYRYTSETMGLSKEKPKYENGNLVNADRLNQYVLGERYELAFEDEEPDCTDIDADLERAISEMNKETDEKYSGIIKTELEAYLKKQSLDLDKKNAASMEAYEASLKSSLIKDAEENKDKAVAAEYAREVISPIEIEYNGRIKELEKQLSLNWQTGKKKKQKKDNSNKEGFSEEKINSIKDEIEKLDEEKKEKIRVAELNIPIIKYYEKRNRRFAEEKKKSLVLAKQTTLKKLEQDMENQLKRRYEPDIDKEKKEGAIPLREKADSRRAERVENETVRRYDIYFRSANSNDTFKDLKKDGGNITDARYLIYDNRAEKAKIDRQESALKAFRGGFVRNPYLASYLFAPQTLKGVSRTFANEPDWCLETLNETQRKAVRQALASESIFLLQGPPGTGKTQVIAEITAQLARDGKKVLISSETHKAIDNVFDRLPKIPEIRPLRLIPSHNGKQTKYSPERLVDNLYINIRESLGTQIDMYENFEETKSKFSERMNELRLDCQKLKELKLENTAINAEREELKQKINECVKRLDDENKQRDEALEKVELFAKTKKYIEAYLTSGEDADRKLLSLFGEKAKLQLEKLSCFAGCGVDKIPSILNADTEKLRAEISEILGDGKIANLEKQRAEKKKILDSFMDEYTYELPSPSDENYEEFKRVQNEFIAIGNQIKELRKGGGIDVTKTILATIVSPDVIADKELLEKLIDEIALLRSGMLTVVSEFGKEVDKKKAVFDAKLQKIENEINAIRREKNVIDERYEEIGASPAASEYTRLHTHLSQSIRRFFDDFKLTGEYEAGDFDAALDIIPKEWKRVERENKKAEKSRTIPMFKDIHKYLGSEEILEEDRRKYTSELYKNANVFGITCTSREKFTSRQLQALKDYGIGDIDLRTQGIDVVIVDEVSKSSFLDLLMPILHGKTVILVGDHRQLPPMYDLRHMRDENFVGLNEKYITKGKNKGYTELYEECFFKTLYEKVPQDFKIMLDKQYRCHGDIMAVFNHFYGGDGLKVGEKNQNDKKRHNLHVRMNGKTLIDPDHHIYFVDCDEKEERKDEGSTSMINKQEADVVMKLLSKINEASLDLVKSRVAIVDEKRDKDERPSVGVICTYGDQAGIIKRRSRNSQYEGFSKKDDEKLIISTVDDFQGDERDIIIVSMVRNPRGKNFNAEFVQKFERINVAFSRPRKLLIIVGAKQFLTEQKIFLPDMSGDEKLDKYNYPVYEKIVNTIAERGRILTARDVLGDK